MADQSGCRNRDPLGDDNAEPAPDVHCGWVDVSPVDFELGWNWARTIVNPVTWTAAPQAVGRILSHPSPMVAL